MKSAMRSDVRILLWGVRLIVFPALLCAAFPLRQDPSLGERSRALDAKLVAACTELARSFDELKDPEAAHFFAECALGFGSTEEKTKEIKKKWETEVYLGRLRGGVVLKDASPIETKLAPLAKEYKAVLDDLVAKAVAKKLSEDERKLLHGVVVKYELARGAHEYVQATQGFNELRAKMKLRAILWDFEASSKLILAGWYMGDTGDYGSKDASDKASWQYSEAVDFAKEFTVRSPRSRYPLSQHADELRSFAVTRSDMLNPDVRRLWLGHWTLGRKHKAMTLYRIPRSDYREDVQTPSRWYSGEVPPKKQDLWNEVEDTVSLGGTRRAVVSHYPYEGEPDTPFAFGEGEDFEHDWKEPRVKDLRKCGLPVMIRVFTIAKLTEVEAALRSKSTGVACRTYLNGDDRVPLGEFATVLLLPEKHLDKGVTYSVSVKGKLDGEPFEKKWSFTTREK
jgi:hypothetical protein